MPWREPSQLHAKSLAQAKVARRGLTLRSSQGPPPASHLAREALWSIVRLAGQVPSRLRPLSSNVSRLKATTVYRHTERECGATSSRARQDGSTRTQPLCEALTSPRFLYSAMKPNSASEQDVEALKRYDRWFLAAGLALCVGGYFAPTSTSAWVLLTLGGVSVAASSFLRLARWVKESRESGSS